jgi:hypothetical protein
MSIVVPRCSTGIRLLFLCFRPVSRVQSNGFVHARVLQRDRRGGKALDNSLILLASLTRRCLCSSRQAQWALSGTRGRDHFRPAD